MDEREEACPPLPSAGLGFSIVRHTHCRVRYLADSMSLFLLNCAFLLLNASVHRFPELMIIFYYFKTGKTKFRR